MENNSIMCRVRHTHKLTNQMNKIGNNWLCDYEIDKTTKQLPIESGISYRFTINSKKLEIRLKRAVGRLTVCRTR